MRSKLLIPFSLFCATVLLACSKHAGDMEESIPVASITFSNPTAGATYRTGDSIQIHALALSTAVMHGYEVAVKNAADTSIVYYSEHIHDHNDTLHISQGWRNTLTTATNLRVEITAVLDHDGHTASNAVNVVSSSN